MKKIVLFILLACLICSCYRGQYPLVKGHEDDFSVDVTLQYVYGNDTLSNLYDWQNFYKQNKFRQNYMYLLINYKIKGDVDKMADFRELSPDFMISRDKGHIASCNLAGGSYIYKMSDNWYQARHPTDFPFPLLPELKQDDKFNLKVGYLLFMKKKIKIFRKKKLIKKEEFIKTFSVGDNTTEL
ncbi:MAG: hypothetical protein JJT94_01380 [Bernardetiaceae bacterium]|nr:hypothetical protein [Bernardetiaceae bacterium]